MCAFGPWEAIAKYERLIRTNRKVRTTDAAVLGPNGNLQGGNRFQLGHRQGSLQAVDGCCCV